MDKIKKDRIKQIKDILENSQNPVSGTKLAEVFKVSRQVIVQDIGILRAQNFNILSTNRGYKIEKTQKVSRIFKVKHEDEDILKELQMFVDLGATVEDVFVEHRTYDLIRADMNIKSRKDVDNFMEDIKNSVSTPLKNITNGYHFHTITADDEETLDIIENHLSKYGFLVES